ncbi:unnamed protein product [Ambrosiozyma monospora]|uniref:Unnamed protein product n=1 Tax=Ambrosiozyma monospora TaxID=43982 RepID=A0A9W7DIB1_AMBMO|nr:unnamed protein product [Ambrosiozyma monospora]
MVDTDLSHYIEKDFNFNSLKVAELRTILKANHVEFDKKARKQTLVSLLRLKIDNVANLSIEEREREEFEHPRLVTTKRTRRPSRLLLEAQRTEEATHPNSGTRRLSSTGANSTSPVSPRVLRDTLLSRHSKVEKVSPKKKRRRKRAGSSPKRPEIGTIVFDDEDDEEDNDVKQENHRKRDKAKEESSDVTEKGLTESNDVLTASAKQSKKTSKKSTTTTTTKSKSPSKKSPSKAKLTRSKKSTRSKANHEKEEGDDEPEPESDLNKLSTRTSLKDFLDTTPHLKSKRKIDEVAEEEGDMDDTSVYKDYSRTLKRPVNKKDDFSNSIENSKINQSGFSNKNVFQKGAPLIFDSDEDDVDGVDSDSKIDNRNILKGLEDQEEPPKTISPSKLSLLHHSSSPLVSPARRSSPIRKDFVASLERPSLSLDNTTALIHNSTNSIRNNGYGSPTRSRSPTRSTRSLRNNNNYNNNNSPNRSSTRRHRSRQPTPQPQSELQSGHRLEHQVFIPRHIISGPQIPIRFDDDSEDDERAIGVDSQLDPSHMYTAFETFEDFADRFTASGAGPGVVGVPLRSEFHANRTNELENDRVEVVFGNGNDSDDDDIENDADVSSGHGDTVEDTVEDRDTLGLLRDGTVYHSFDNDDHKIVENKVEESDHDPNNDTFESQPSTPFKQSIPVHGSDDEEHEADTKPVVKKAKAKNNKSTRDKRKSKKSKKSKAKISNNENELPQIRTPEMPKDNSAELKTITNKVNQQTNKIEKDSKEALAELSKSKCTANKNSRFIYQILPILFLVMLFFTIGSIYKTQKYYVGFCDYSMPNPHITQLKSRFPDNFQPTLDTMETWITPSCTMV